jgi:hypothetical protein
MYNVVLMPLSWGYPRDTPAYILFTKRVYDGYQANVLWLLCERTVVVPWFR